MSAEKLMIRLVHTHKGTRGLALHEFDFKSSSWLPRGHVYTGRYRLHEALTAHAELIAQEKTAAIIAKLVSSRPSRAKGIAKRAVMALAAILMMPLMGCANYATVELAHTSHVFAGPPFGPQSEEDSLDRINACVGRERGAWYAEACFGYMYVESGFFGPRETFDGRIGRKFRFGQP